MSKTIRVSEKTYQRLSGKESMEGVSLAITAQVEAAVEWFEQKPALIRLVLEATDSELKRRLIEFLDL